MSPLFRPTAWAVPLVSLFLGACSTVQYTVDDGRKVTGEMVRHILEEELPRIKASVLAQGEQTESYEQAAKIFGRMSLTPDYPEFLTLPLYEEME